MKPLILGGQGRSDAEVESSASVVGWVIFLTILLAIGIVSVANGTARPHPASVEVRR